MLPTDQRKEYYKNSHINEDVITTLLLRHTQMLNLRTFKGMAHLLGDILYLGCVYMFSIIIGDLPASVSE